MSNAVPPAVHELVGNPTASDAEHWFMQDLTVEELARTVAVINSAMRATRSLEQQR